MKQFIGEDFLLSNKISVELYHDVAKDMPIVDYHNHLSPKDIFEDRAYKNLTEIWLEDDHYKWRALRANGVSEKFITGDANPKDKFLKWAETVPYTLRNPLYHWTHMELKNPFGIDKLLNPDSANYIWDACNEQLQTSKLSAQGLLQHWNVTNLCTTDDPLDSLIHHKEIEKNDHFKIEVLPTFRADNFLKIEDSEFINSYFEKLGSLTNSTIENFENLKLAISNRHAYFHGIGCRMFDVALPYAHVTPYSEKGVTSIIQKSLSKTELTIEEIEQYKSAILEFLCTLNAEKKWTQQFHIGALRNNNSMLMDQLGADKGCDSLDDLSQARHLSVFLDRLRKSDKLAHTVLYNLNPKDNAVFAAMIGNFNHNSEAGKLQFGAAWWFNDQKEGIISNLNTISNYGLLRRFVGMLTDSRSLLSFSRHEYFRRILCELVGTDVVHGELPYDKTLLKQLIEDVCYHNAKKMF